MYQYLRHETKCLWFNLVNKKFEQFGLNIWCPQELQKNR